jgi:hypothetical protein
LHKTRDGMSGGCVACVGCDEARREENKGGVLLCTITLLGRLLSTSPHSTTGSRVGSNTRPSRDTHTHTGRERERGRVVRERGWEGGRERELRSFSRTHPLVTTRIFCQLHTQHTHFLPTVPNPSMNFIVTCCVLVVLHLVMHAHASIS